MIQFSQLKIEQRVEDIDPIFSTKRYVIGADPFNQRGVLSKSNVFVVYDKYTMREQSRTVTKLTFDKWLEWILKHTESSCFKLCKREYIVSYKFINKNGTATNPVQIR
jgi:hypothetical protein